MVDVLKPRTLLSADFTNFLVFHLWLYQALHLLESTKYTQLEAEIPETARKNAHPNSSLYAVAQGTICALETKIDKFIRCSVPVDCFPLTSIAFDSIDESLCTNHIDFSRVLH